MERMRLFELIWINCPILGGTPRVRVCAPGNFSIHLQMQIVWRWALQKMVHAFFPSTSSYRSVDGPECDPGAVIYTPKGFACKFTFALPVFFSSSVRFPLWRCAFAHSHMQPDIMQDREESCWGFLQLTGWTISVDVLGMSRNRI